MALIVGSYFHDLSYFANARDDEFDDDIFDQILDMVQMKKSRGRLILTQHWTIYFSIFKVHFVSWIPHFFRHVHFPSASASSQ